MHNKLPIVLAVVLTASMLLVSSSVYASGVTSSATVLNAAPTVEVGLAPDDNTGAPGVQVINPDWQTQDRTVTITATVTDLNGLDDLTGTVTAMITGPDPVNDSPVSLTFDYNTSAIATVYTGIFNMSGHAEGDYTVEVTADDSGGLSGTVFENFTYLHAAGDVTQPTVTAPAATPNSIIADGAEESELSVNVIDASGIYAVTIDLSLIGGNSAQLMTNIAGTNTYTTTTSAAVGTTPGMYSLPVTATDNSPNNNANSDVSILLTVLPNEVVATYDFTTGVGSDKWAFRKQHFEKPPLDNDEPGDEFTAEQYEPIKVDDGVMRGDASAARGFYAIHRFRFSIAEPEDTITRIDILWDGKATHDWGTDGATLYVWNFRTGAYEQLDSSNTDNPITLEGSVTTTIDDYLGPDGNLIIVAEQNTEQWKLWRWSFYSRLSTDYMKVDITSTPQPDVAVLGVTPDVAVINHGNGMQERYNTDDIFEVEP